MGGEGEGEGEAHDSEEEINDPDKEGDDDARNGSNAETGEGDTETESGGAKEQRRTEGQEMDIGFERESDAGYSTPRPASPVQQDPMDFLLRWTTKKPFFTHAKIEEWERQVAPSLVRSSPSSSKTARNPNRSGAN
jgi:hypothetical protein